MDSVPPPLADTSVAAASSGLRLTLPVLPAAVSRRWSITLKLVLITVLVGVLHVPLLMVWDTLSQRQRLRDSAVAEIGRTWGGMQTILGPVLAVPYTQQTRVPRQTVVADRVVQTEELREVKGTAYFLPQRFEAAGALEISERHRGIFRTPVYATELALTGEFRPDPAALGLEPAALEWAKARVLVSVSDPHALRSTPAWSQGGAEAAFVPSAVRDGGWGGIEAPAGLADEAGARAPFACTLSLQGSTRIAVVPVGEANSVALRGAWADPSFDGAYLPAERTVAAEGFSARWATTHFGRAFPSAWIEQPGREGLRAHVLAASALGVTLATPVDTYRMVERSLKYALLVLTLVFAVYFLIEVTSPVRVHPLQYLMVGAALVLFYLGFLALAEFAPVATAYAAAATVSTALVGGYSWSVLRAGARSLLVTAGLAGTYGYVYFMLQLQDYALLSGTGALFALLAAAMWFTRRLDWSSIESRAPAKA
ncbi:MAG: cell envelope integrity protein CreD [Opitutaceae bacterium]|nr:cell envelope integrity protein CreD [Opitutaceae bacterium]